MTISMGRIAAMLVAAAVAMPLSAGAQEPPKKEEPAKAAPAKPAPPVAKPAPPAARPAPPPPAARAPAPPPPAARAPAQHPQPPAARVAPQRPTPPAARVAPSRPEPQRATAPAQKQAPAASRAVPQQQRAQERIQQRQQAQPKAAAPLQQQAQPKAAGPQLQKSAAPQVQQPVSAAQTRQQQRQVQRQERALQQRENRALRALPPKQRAARQQEIKQQRAQRAQQRQQAQPNALQAQPKAAVQTNSQTRGVRRNGQARVTPQAARQGRFASTFAAQAQTANAGTNAGRTRSGRFAARQAWSRGLRAGFTPWFGPVFWPYAYSDVFDYAFWPDGYDDGYFAYAYDDFFDGVFFGEAGAPEEYVGAIPSDQPRPSYAAVQELCKQPGSGVTAWPVADIEKKVGLNDEQKQLLADVKNAGIKAANAFKASCPSENAFPLTPPGRLTAMTARLDATLEAVQTVKPALEKFYASLSDEQKERFNEIGPKTPKEPAAASQASADTAQSCKEQKPGLTNLPIERIEDAVKPTDAQETELKNLEDATAKAVSIMQAACPEDTPITPPGRLEAMETRLQAMIDAAKTVKPALSSFYGSLNAEQKARFNRIGGQLAQTTGSSQ